MGKDKPKIGLDDSRREVLKSWVAQFLSYWEDADMLSTEAAEIIVNEIIKVHSCLDEDLSQKDPSLLPEVESFFQDQEG